MTLVELVVALAAPKNITFSREYSLNSFEYLNKLLYLTAVFERRRIALRVLNTSTRASMVFAERITKAIA